MEERRGEGLDLLGVGRGGGNSSGVEDEEGEDEQVVGVGGVAV